jgi:hypothetical protein
VIPAFPEDSDEFGMNSTHSKMGKVETSLLRVLARNQTTDSPGIMPAVKGQLPGMNFVFHKDGLYIIGERVQGPTVEQGQRRNEKNKSAGSWQYVLGGFESIF